jgi:tetratricopeptide (TPR) repeat protein
MKKVSLTSILFIVFRFTIISQSIDLQTQYSYAQNLIAEQNYKLALKENLRLYFYDKDNLYPTICKDIANNFLALQDNVNALKYFDLYYFKTKDEKEKNEIRYEKQKIYLLQGDFNKALTEILQINKRVDIDKDRYFFMLSINYFFSNEFIKAKKNITQLSYYDKIDTNRINKNITRLIKNNSKKTNNAMFYSAIVPGLGQSINGDIKDGVNSLGLFVGLGSILLDLGSEIGYSDASLSVGPWLVRYYVGGILNAKKSAERKKFNKKQKNILEIVQLIQAYKNNHDAN